MPRTNGRVLRKDFLVSYTVTNYVTVRAVDEEEAARRVTDSDGPRFAGREFTIKKVETL
jgi:hypothetical protein